jgi:hypothetical protein
MPDAEHERYVGRVVDRTPAPGFAVRSEPLPQDPRYNKQHHEIGGDGAKAYVEGAERRKERHDSVERVHALGEDLGGDMDYQEGHGAERSGTMRRLDEDPVTRVQDHAIGRDQSERDGCAQRYQREDAGVVEHEVLGSGIDDVSCAGQRQERDDSDHARYSDAIELGGVLGDRAARGRAGDLTAAGTAAS